MKETLRQEEINVEALLQPETGLETQILKIPEFRTGLFWGKPRYGHPEGKVVFHIREILDNIDRLAISPKDREKLRLVAFVHDTFKYQEEKYRQKDKSTTQHHATLASNFLQAHSDDLAVLQIIQLHDEAYYSWRMIHQYHEVEAGKARLQQLLTNLGEHLQLYYLFFKCDTRTGDKNQSPLQWFETSIEGIEVLDL